jgi:YD repeat-containing protein
MGGGQFCGRNDIRNNALSKRMQQFDFTRGTGVKQTFEYSYKSRYKPEPGVDDLFLQKWVTVKAPVEYYRIASQENLNGSKLHYSYHKGGKLQEIRATDAAGKVEFGKIACYEGKDTYTIKGSNGHEVTYRLHPDRNTIVGVESTARPKMCYGYHKGKISARYLPNQHFLKIKYYEEGDKFTDLDGEEQVIAKKHEGKVQSLLSRSTRGYEAAETHRFFYNWRKTSVQDANGHITHYDFDKYRRLTRVTKKETIFNFEWDKQGQLVKESTCNGKEESVFSKRRYFDDLGNVICERIFGNITGGGSGESFAKYFSYSTDGLNLLKSEDNDDNCKVKIFYKSGTDLITSKHTYHDGQMVRRTFFSYDKFGSITKLVQDDGITIDESDLTGVTERHIQRTVPRAKIPFGVPSVVSDFALDLATGQERLLHKKKIDYREDGMVTKEEHFDGDDTYRYTLLWEYDSHGNLTREVDALGQEVTYVYDENDCLVTERRPSVTKRFVYDGCNRVLKETLKKNGQEICTKYRYDVMGNLIKTFDSCGRCKLFQYDAQDRLVSVTDCPTCGTQKFAYDPLEPSQQESSWYDYTPPHHSSHHLKSKSAYPQPMTPHSSDDQQSQQTTDEEDQTNSSGP